MSDEVRAQYATNTNLVRRANLHAAYGKVGWFDWLARRMALEPGAVLDVGCGPGWLWRRAGVLDGVDLTLLDTSPAMVAEATAALPGTTGVEGDAMALPFEAESFDAVVMMHMLYHVPDVGRALDEADRVLKPGGKIFITTNTPENLMELTALSAEVFGTSPFDPAAELFSLADAHTGLFTRYGAAERFDLEETYAVDDPEIIMDFLTSMPPANAGSESQRATLRDLVDKALAEGGGILKTQKQTGLVRATKPASGGES